MTTVARLYPDLTPLYQLGQQPEDPDVHAPHASTVRVRDWGPGGWSSESLTQDDPSEMKKTTGTAAPTTATPALAATTITTTTNEAYSQNVLSSSHSPQDSVPTTHARYSNSVQTKRQRCSNDNHQAPVHNIVGSSGQHRQLSPSRQTSESEVELTADYSFLSDVENESWSENLPPDYNSCSTNSSQLKRTKLLLSYAHNLDRSVKHAQPDKVICLDLSGRVPQSGSDPEVRPVPNVSPPAEVSRHKHGTQGNGRVLREKGDNPRQASEQKRLVDARHEKTSSSAPTPPSRHLAAAEKLRAVQSSKTTPQAAGPTRENVSSGADYDAWMAWRKQVNSRLASAILQDSDGVVLRGCVSGSGVGSGQHLSQRSMDCLFQRAVEGEGTRLQEKTYIMYGIPRPKVKGVK